MVSTLKLFVVCISVVCMLGCSKWMSCVELSLWSIAVRLVNSFINYFLCILFSFSLGFIYFRVISYFRRSYCEKLLQNIRKYYFQQMFICSYMTFVFYKKLVFILCKIKNYLKTTLLLKLFFLIEFVFSLYYRYSHV